MTFGERVFQYCERGTNEALWAEPINAVSNAGFFLAALIFWQLVLWRPPEQRSADHYLFVALVFLIGGGSLAFHLYADKGTSLADTIPIVVFMLVYLGFALNRFLSCPPGWTVLLVVLFAALIAASMQIHCWEGGIGFSDAASGAKVCLNGSVGYLPALGALIIIGMLLAERRHKAAPYVLAATVTFAVALLLRTVDFGFCERVVIEGRNVGTHFIWHLLNALVLFLLLRASLETETRPLPPADAVQAPAEDKPPVAATAAGAATPEAKASEAQTKDVPEPREKRQAKSETGARDAAPKSTAEPAAAAKKKAEDREAQGNGPKSAPGRANPADRAKGSKASKGEAGDKKKSP